MAISKSDKLYKIANAKEKETSSKHPHNIYENKENAYLASMILRAYRIVVFTVRDLFRLIKKTHPEPLEIEASGCFFHPEPGRREV